MGLKSVHTCDLQCHFWCDFTDKTCPTRRRWPLSVQGRLLGRDSTWVTQSCLHEWYRPQEQICSWLPFLVARSHLKPTDTKEWWSGVVFFFQADRAGEIFTQTPHACLFLDTSVGDFYLVIVANTFPLFRSMICPNSSTISSEARSRGRLLKISTDCSRGKRLGPTDLPWRVFNRYLNRTRINVIRRKLVSPLHLVTITDVVVALQTKFGLEMEIVEKALHNGWMRLDKREGRGGGLSLLKLFKLYCSKRNYKNN